MAFLRNLLLVTVVCALNLQAIICEKIPETNGNKREENGTKQNVARGASFVLDRDYGYDTAIQPFVPIKPIAEPILNDPYRTESAEFYGVSCLTSPQNRIIAVGACQTHFFLCRDALPEKISCFDLIKISRPNNFDIYTDYVFNYLERRCEPKDRCDVQKNEQFSNIKKNGVKFEVSESEMKCDEGQRFPMSYCSNRFTVWTNNNLILRTCINGTVFDPESNMCSCNVRGCRYAHWALNTYCSLEKERDSGVYTPLEAEEVDPIGQAPAIPVSAEESLKTVFDGQKMDPNGTNLIILPLGEGPDGMKRGLCGYIVPCHYKQDSSGFIVKVVPPMINKTSPLKTTTLSTTSATETTTPQTTTAKKVPCIPVTTSNPNVIPNCTHMQPTETTTTTQPTTTPPTTTAKQVPCVPVTTSNPNVIPNCTYMQPAETTTTTVKQVPCTAGTTSKPNVICTYMQPTETTTPPTTTVKQVPCKAGTTSNPNTIPGCKQMKPIIYTNLKPPMFEDHIAQPVNAIQSPMVGNTEGRYFLDEFNTLGLRFPSKRYMNPFHVKRFNQKPTRYIDPFTGESILRVQKKK